MSTRTPRSRRPLACTVALSALVALAATACASGAGDSAGPSTLPVIRCPEPEVAAPADGLTVALAGPVVFVDGVAASSSSAGHAHTGPLVAEGESHLHYCLVLANGYADPVTVQAIQVLPDDSEEPLAVVESGPLVESFDDRAQAEQIDPGGRAALELLVPAEGPVTALHQRVAYTVEGDDGWRDLFVDETLSTAG